MKTDKITDFSCGVRFLMCLSNSARVWRGESYSGINYDKWRVDNTTDESLIVDLSHGYIYATTQYLFSDFVREEGTHLSPGQRLAALIVRRGWGELVQGPIKVNSNSGNKICVWIWSPNKQAQSDLGN